TTGQPGRATSVTGHLRLVFTHVKIENLVAGLSGGVVSTLVLHPLDLVKIRFRWPGLRPKYSGMLHCMKSVWQQEGLKGLYQGVTPNVWGAGASWVYPLFLTCTSHIGLFSKTHLFSRV
uniref:Solute carrier family 25 member 32a n=1 Tax=Gouania willdenowi TaxID=441366 RepID=A0A8C5DWP1_GOUWI